MGGEPFTASWRRRQRIGDLLAEEYSAVDRLENAIWMQQLRRAVNESLAKLPMEWRRIMVRRYWMGQTLQQIAAAEGKSHQAISAKENSALRRMRKWDTGGRLAEFACQF